MTLLLITSTVSLGLALGWARRSLAVVTVTGDSMAPTYSDGDRVLVRRSSLARVRRGDVVLVERPGAETGWVGPPERGRVTSRHWIIKRAVAVAGDPLAPHLVDDRARTFVPADRLVVLGDNPNRSYDSRDFGFVEPQRLFGVVFRRLTAGPRVDALVRARS